MLHKIGRFSLNHTPGEIIKHTREGIHNHVQVVAIRKEIRSKTHTDSVHKRRLNTIASSIHNTEDLAKEESQKKRTFGGPRISVFEPWICYNRVMMRSTKRSAGEWAEFGHPGRTKTVAGKVSSIHTCLYSRQTKSINNILIHVKWNKQCL